MNASMTLTWLRTLRPAAATVLILATLWPASKLGSGMAPKLPKRCLSPGRQTSIRPSFHAVTRSEPSPVEAASMIGE